MEIVVFNIAMRNAFNILSRQALMDGCASFSRTIALGIMVLWAPSIIVVSIVGTPFSVWSTTIDSIVPRSVTMTASNILSDLNGMSKGVLRCHIESRMSVGHF